MYLGDFAARRLSRSGPVSRRLVPSSAKLVSRARRRICASEGRCYTEWVVRSTVAAQRGFIGFVVRRKGCGRGEVGVCVSEIIMVERTGRLEAGGSQAGVHRQDMHDEVMHGARGCGCLGRRPSVLTSIKFAFLWAWTTSLLSSSPSILTAFQYLRIPTLYSTFNVPTNAGYTARDVSVSADVPQTLLCYSHPCGDPTTRCAHAAPDLIC